MINPPKGLNGISGNPITLKALNDGKVDIDGQDARHPVLLTGNDYFVLEGFNAHNCSEGSVVKIYNSNNIIVRRVIGWDTALGDNGGIFGCHHGNNFLFEDCAGWDRARKIYSASQNGNNATFRRCFGMWSGSSKIGPKMTITGGYNNYNMIIENFVGTWDQTQMDGEVDQPYGVLGVDRWDGSKQASSKVLGSVFYTLKEQTVRWIIANAWIGKIVITSLKM